MSPLTRLQPLRLTDAVACAGWHNAFADPLASCAEDFETKRQRINRLQEGQPFGEVRASRVHAARLGPKANARCAAGRALHAAHLSRHGGGVQGTGEGTSGFVRARLGVVLTRRRMQWMAAHPVPADLSEEEFLEREYWCATPRVRRSACAACAALITARARRRRVEGGEEQVTVDYANDLDTGMCVASRRACCALFVCSRGPCVHSYGSGFARSPDVSDSDCGWNLNRLNENPENVLRAVGSCLPGVTRCALHTVSEASRASHIDLQALAVHGHALRHLLLAQGGP